MRYVPSISSTTTSPDTRPVRGLSATHAVKPVHPREQPVPIIEQHAAHREAAQPAGQQPRRDAVTGERRKVCRRVSHQPVLVEFRSGVDRRRHNLRAGDVVEHIDEKV
jgi:hypothetical protein